MIWGSDAEPDPEDAYIVGTASGLIIPQRKKMKSRQIGFLSEDIMDGMPKKMKKMMKADKMPDSKKASKDRDLKKKMARKAKGAY